MACDVRFVDVPYSKQPTKRLASAIVTKVLKEKLHLLTKEKKIPQYKNFQH